MHPGKRRSDRATTVVRFYAEKSVEINARPNVISERTSNRPSIIVKFGANTVQWFLPIALRAITKHAKKREQFFHVVRYRFGRLAERYSF